MHVLDRVVLVGGGGHCKSVLDALMRAGVTVAGTLDNDPSRADVLGVAVLGTDAALPDLIAKGHPILITVGSVRDNITRDRLFAEITAMGADRPALIAQSAIVSPAARIGAGCVIMERAVVNVGAVVGDNCIVNTGAIVEHDARVGRSVHIAPGAILGGGVRVGDLAFIGSGATLIQGIAVGDRAVVGAGAVVIRDIPPGAFAVGNPATIKSEADL
jgi:UDP-perosamine 4-acetyltransferase